MNHFQKGFGLPILLIILGLAVVAGGGVYWYMQNQYSPTAPVTPTAEVATHEPQTPSPSNTTPTNSPVSTTIGQYVISGQKTLPTTADLKATIDSVDTTSPFPIIKGTASGSLTSILGMNLYSKDPTYHGYYSGNVTFSNGHWSAKLGSLLPPGTYFVEMNILGGESSYGSNNIVTTATLTVKTTDTTALPTKIGQCATVVVAQVGTRLVDAVGSGSAITYTNGGYQVSYSQVAGIDHSKSGDQVQLCLVSQPTNCPAGDTRGKVYSGKNLRTGETWQEADSQHVCGGA